jgi:hypothetical protein
MGCPACTRRGDVQGTRRRPRTGSPADQDELVVLEVEGKHLRIPKARIDALVEVD